MSAIKPLQTLLECARRERDEALSRFEQHRVAHQAATDQAQALLQWRAEYAQRWQGQFAQGGSVEIVRCYQDFMARLTQAITDQDMVVGRTHNSLEAARAVLAAREQRMAAVEQLIERRLRDLAAVARRREQKDTDEQAARTQANQGSGMRAAAAYGWSSEAAEVAVSDTQFDRQSDFVPTTH